MGSHHVQSQVGESSRAAPHRACRNWRTISIYGWVSCLPPILMFVIASSSCDGPLGKALATCAVKTSSARAGRSMMRHGYSIASRSLMTLRQLWNKWRVSTE